MRFCTHLTVTTIERNNRRHLHNRQLRRSLRLRRNQVSHFQQQTAASHICQRVARLPAWQGARRIALYCASDGEVNPHLLMSMAWQQGKQVYLPVLHPFKSGRMVFVRVKPGTSLQRNRWGIDEPRLCLRNSIPAAHLDLVLVPLVGFDGEGRRLGMGKGFYDRAFAFRQSGTKRPILVGLGHDCQEVPAGEIFEAAWDVRLDKLVTPERYLQVPPAH
ncbi:5-formyltetrahydrofolate cyclo-ligase [Pseudohongiella nitratireducens]|mgnify:CR=1 FL=1|uniref:5-formyltetrahydrofolate cyclo-ligase n=1 Tax=Pseudohongiella nitratireducens TaxID=1768907 RepID=UPI0024094F10|nr:5-formyltetrahydrofolate cyclo-ligase [Pseudohongiella nitratireducens]MDF1622320.1 5-formyltetrahydrofolate cyclo-ligase [Pseudohongiella nitratireducens]